MQLVNDVLAHLSRDGKSGQSVWKRPPTPAPKRVRSTDRNDTKPSANSSSDTLSREGWCGRSSSAEGRCRSQDGPSQCYRCKGYGHFASDCPSQDFYKIGPNGLPIWVRNPSRDSSTEKKKEVYGEEACHQGFKLGEGHSKSPGSDPAEGEVSPKQSSGGQACLKTEPAQAQKQTGVEAHIKPKMTAPKSAKPRVCSRS